MSPPVWLSAIHRPQVLLIVAHPDDETIFAGGCILTSKGARWTIVCCFAEGHRRGEFLDACSFLEAASGNPINPIPLNMPRNPAYQAVALRGALRHHRGEHDIVVTHNRQGEYGHPKHKLVHRCVMDAISHPNTWVFISPGSTGGYPEDVRSQTLDGNITLHLPPTVLRLKIQAFQECHRSQAQLYGYDSAGKLRDTEIRETLRWQFESGREEFAFYR
jgi:LmbE family N-acetylglucosaminyl deacetylase